MGGNERYSDGRWCRAALKRSGASQPAAPRPSSLLSPEECGGNRRALISGNRGRVYAAPVRGGPPRLDAADELLLGAVIRAELNRKRHIQDVTER